MPASSPASRRVLVIAGSDSSGGAGLEADQRVLALHGCYALTAITGVTSQTTTGVHAIHEIPTQFVLDTINRVWDDIGVDVVKIGMLTSASTAAGVASLLAERRKAGYTFSVVLDPVMKSTSGAALLPSDAASIIRKDLLPLATVVTPNIPEAEALLPSDLSSVKSWMTTPQPPPHQDIPLLIHLAQDVWRLSRQGSVLVKGGHGAAGAAGAGGQAGVGGVAGQAEQAGGWVTDVLYDGEESYLYEQRRVETKNVHGTGCSLASAIAANLALGLDMREAVARANEYVYEGILAAVDWRLGQGSGPIDHWAGSTFVSDEYGGKRILYKDIV